MTHSHFRRTMFIAAMAFGAGVIGPPAVAVAAPEGEWDIAAYDECMKKTVRSPEGCCLVTGGVITPDGNSCQAPPAVAQDSRGQQGAVAGTPPVPAGPPQGSAPQQGAVEGTTTTLPMPPRDVYQLPQFGTLG